jgi:hypothetical protein
VARPQHHARRTRVRPQWFGPLAAMAAVAVLTATLFWLSLELDRSPPPMDRETPDTDHGTSQPAPSDPDSELQAVIDAAVEECRWLWRAQESPLNAAATSLAQWQAHIDAMNQLVAGAITLDQATLFWEQTRVEAAQNVRAFTAADRAHVAGDRSCRSPLTADDTAVDVETLSACEEAVEARAEVLDAARVSIQTWHHHVIDMNLLRAGKLSPELALELWRRFWKQGLEELAAYGKQLGETASESCEGA